MLKEIRNDLMEALRPFAQEHGFKIAKNRFEMYKKTRDKNIRVMFLTCYWLDEVEIEPYINIIVYPVHEICEKFGLDLNYTVTINLLLLNAIGNAKTVDWQSIWRFRYDERDRLTIHNSEHAGYKWFPVSKDIRYAKDQIIDYDENTITNIMKWMDRLLPIALEYLDKYSSIEGIDHLFNTELSKATNPHTTNRVTHAFVGLIAAWLNNNPNYEKIKKHYLHVMSDPEMLESTRLSFRNLAEGIDHLNKNDYMIS